MSIISNIIAFIIVLFPFWIGLIIVAALIYTSLYFKGKRFDAIKNDISTYISDCNELNAHIDELRSSYINMHKTDYGEASYQNISNYQYKKSGIANAKYAPNIYDCSRQVCDNARKQPFKYICKYFNIKENEESLQQFEEILNNFLSAEDGKSLSLQKRNDILKSISVNVPWIIRSFFQNTLIKKLGFEPFSFNELYFPKFSFRYISSGGNSGNQFTITLDIPMMERFVEYLSEKVKFKKSIAGQRRLMTPKLRKFIIDRDNCTCQKCRNSTRIEPNLLLEVDHIVPLAKGGITSEDNLQTLCWKCNRHKGARIA